MAIWSVCHVHMPEAGAGGIEQDPVSSREPRRSSAKPLLLKWKGHFAEEAPTCTRCPVGLTHFLVMQADGNSTGVGNPPGYCYREQPAWSAYRESSFGHGTLDIVNDTHALWSCERLSCPWGHCPGRPVSSPGTPLMLPSRLNLLIIAWRRGHHPKVSPERVALPSWHMCGATNFGDKRRTCMQCTEPEEPRCCCFRKRTFRIMQY